MVENTKVMTLSKFRIVIPKDATVNESTFAYALRYHLKKVYQCSLDVVSDSDTVTENEILVGGTSCTADKAENFGFAVSARGGKLHLVATDMRGYQAMYSYVVNTLFADTESSIEDGFEYTAKAPSELNDGTVFATESYGDMRIMFYNIYGGRSQSGGQAVRFPLQREIVATYAPTVLGLQETTQGYHEGFTPMLEELGYTTIDGYDDGINHTLLYYKADRVTLLDSGFLLYSGANNANSKSLTWGVFEDRATTKKFAVINTHFMWSDPALAEGEANRTRVSNARELIGVKNAILEKYPNIPVIMGGDLNCKVHEEPHGILKNGGMVSVWEKATVKNDSGGRKGYSTYDAEEKTFTASPKVWGFYTDSIDHAYATPNTNVKTYCSLADLYCQWTSDHMPVVVEFDLN